MKDLLINLSVDNFFRHPLHWGVLKFWEGKKRKRFGVVFYKTTDVFSPDKTNIYILHLFFCYYSKQIIYKTRI